MFLPPTHHLSDGGHTLSFPLDRRSLTEKTIIRVISQNTRVPKAWEGYLVATVDAQDIILTITPDDLKECFVPSQTQSPETAMKPMIKRRFASQIMLQMIFDKLPNQKRKR